MLGHIDWGVWSDRNPSLRRVCPQIGQIHGLIWSLFQNSKDVEVTDWKITQGCTKNLTQGWCSVRNENLFQDLVLARSALQNTWSYFHASGLQQYAVSHKYLESHFPGRFITPLAWGRIWPLHMCYWSCRMFACCKILWGFERAGKNWWGRRLGRHFCLMVWVMD